MTQDEALLASIVADPDDDTPRLIYADWLEEHGQPERAEFIRVQCEIVRLKAIVEKWVRTPSNQPGGTREDGGPAGAALAEAQILEEREQELLKEGVPLPLTFDRYFSTPEGQGFWLVNSCFYVTFRRGFVEVLTCGASAWVAHAEQLVQAAPIREVYLTSLAPPMLQTLPSVGAAWTDARWPGVRFQLANQAYHPILPPDRS